MYRIGQMSSFRLFCLKSPLWVVIFKSSGGLPPRMQFDAAEAIARIAAPGRVWKEKGIESPLGPIRDEMAKLSSPYFQFLSSRGYAEIVSPSYRVDDSQWQFGVPELIQREFERRGMAQDPAYYHNLGSYGGTPTPGHPFAAVLRSAIVGWGSFDPRLPFSDASLLERLENESAISTKDASLIRDHHAWCMGTYKDPLAVAEVFDLSIPGIGSVFYIGTFIVHHDRQRNGIGTTLFDATARLTDEKGEMRPFILRTSDEDAKAFYLHQGGYHLDVPSDYQGIGSYSVHGWGFNGIKGKGDFEQAARHAVLLPAVRTPKNPRVGVANYLHSVA